MKALFDREVKALADELAAIGAIASGIKTREHEQDLHEKVDAVTRRLDVAVQRVRALIGPDPVRGPAPELKFEPPVEAPPADEPLPAVLEPNGDPAAT